MTAFELLVRPTMLRHLHYLKTVCIFVLSVYFAELICCITSFIIKYVAAALQSCTGTQSSCKSLVL